MDMVLEDDISLWGKVVGIAVGVVGLLVTFLGIFRKLLRIDFEGRIIALESHMEDMSTRMAEVQSQLLDNSRHAMKATAEAALVADRLKLQGESFEKNVVKLLDSYGAIVSALQDVDAKVDDLAQHGHE